MGSGKVGVIMSKNCVCDGSNENCCWCGGTGFLEDGRPIPSGLWEPEGRKDIPDPCNAADAEAHEPHQIDEKTWTEISEQRGRLRGWSAHDDQDTDSTRINNTDNRETYAEEVNLTGTDYADEVVANSELRWHKLTHRRFVLQISEREDVRIAKNRLGLWDVKGMVHGVSFGEKNKSRLHDAFVYADRMVRFLGKEEKLSRLRRPAAEVQ